MAERLLLSQLDISRDHNRTQSTHERSLRLLIKAMAEVIHEPVTPELIEGLAVVIEHWPDAHSEPPEG
jgi:hypothetical protein